MKTKQVLACVSKRSELGTCSRTRKEATWRRAGSEREKESQRVLGKILQRGVQGVEPA
jgi:hypothetical protein